MEAGVGADISREAVGMVEWLFSFLGGGGGAHPFTGNVNNRAQWTGLHMEDKTCLAAAAAQVQLLAAE